VLITIAAILAILWLLGFVVHVGGNVIHILLVIAVIVFIYDALVKRRGRDV
jgi:hypothetical protein